MPLPIRRFAPLGAGGALVLLTVLAYLPAVRGGFVWDDDSWTLRLAGLFRDASGLRTIWTVPTAMQQYYPLTGTTFWLDYQLWRFWPLPYHVENVLLHVGAALLFWRLLRRLEIPGAWLASALFALHPVMVESVAWIAERKNVLSLSLYLAAALAYERYAREPPGSAPRPPEPTAAHRLARRVSLPYILAFLLFAGALLAKTTACSFPAAILLVIWWRRGRLRWRQDVLPTLPFFAAGLAMCAVTIWLERQHVGAHGADFSLTVAQRLLIAGRSFWFYLGKLLWPANLSFVYPRWQPDAGAWAQWLYPLTATGALVALWRARSRIGRGPVTALLLFTGTLFPTLGFVNVYYMRYSFVCDHWAYLPSLGPLALAAAGLARLPRHLGGPRRLWAAGGGVLLLALALLTWRQAGMYGNAELLWRTTLQRNPDSWMAHNSLGNLLFRKGRPDEAIGSFRQAIRLKPDLAEAHTSLGVALGSRGRLDDAIASFETAIRVKPDYAEAHYDLGLAFEQSGRLDEAISHLREATRLKPRFPAAQRRLGRLLLRMEPGDLSVPP